MLKRSECPYCNPHSFPKTINKTNGESKPKIAKLTKEEKRLNRSQKYFDKVKENSKGLVSVLQYNGAKEKLTAHCNECGNEWEIRADHLLVRTYCPLCRKRNSN
jgi:ribosomal protein L44E